MPTDEQRHEVAEILHACADTYNEAEQCLQRYGVSFHKIADLIEPSEPVVFQCAHCGGVWHKQPTYCPCCGKKVE